MKMGCAFALFGILLVALLAAVAGQVFARSIENFNPETFGKIGFFLVVIPAFALGFWLQKRKSSAGKNQADGDSEDKGES